MRRVGHNEMLAGLLAGVLLVVAACNDGNAADPAESPEPPDSVVPILQLLETGAGTAYQAGYHQERAGNGPESSRSSVETVTLDVEALGLDEESANLVVTHDPEHVRVDFVRVDTPIALFDHAEEGRFSCITSSVNPQCEPIDAESLLESLRPVSLFVPETALGVLRSDQDWTGARVDVAGLQEEIGGQSSDCITVEGVAPALIGASDVEEWELCVTIDGIVSRFAAGDTTAELVEYGSGAPEDLLAVPDVEVDADPVLLVAEGIDERLRSLAALEGEDESPRATRFLDQVEDEELSVAFAPAPGYAANGRLTIVTGRGAACLVVPTTSDEAGEISLGPCDGG